MQKPLGGLQTASTMKQTVSGLQLCSGQPDPQECQDSWHAWDYAKRPLHCSYKGTEGIREVGACVPDLRACCYPLHHGVGQQVVHGPVIYVCDAGK